MGTLLRSLQTSDGFNGGFEVRFVSYPVKQPQAVAILIHGMGGYSGRWEEFATVLQNEGVTALALDLPGFGRTFGPRGHIDNFRKYQQTLNALVALVKGEHPGLKVFLIGESMGALVAADYVCHVHDQVAGVVMISPAITATLRMSWQKKLKAIIGLATNPMAKIDLGFRARMFTRDESLWARIDNDPMEVRVVTPRFLFSVLKAMSYVRLHAETIHVPVLVLQAGRDVFVDPKSSERFFERLGSPDKTFKLFPDHFHALYIDKDREPVFKEMVTWLRTHSGR